MHTQIYYMHFAVYFSLYYILGTFTLDHALTGTLILPLLTKVTSIEQQIPWEESRSLNNYAIPFTLYFSPKSATKWKGLSLIILVYNTTYFYNVTENILISTYTSNLSWIIYLNIQTVPILKMSSQVTYNWLRLARVSKYHENHLFSSKFQAFLGRMLSNWLPATLTQFLG